MSLPPEPRAQKKGPVPPWRQAWDTWRILMMAGALVLLVLAFTRVGGEDRLPGWFSFVATAIGYGLLAFGFLLAMRRRREIKAKREEKSKKVSPRDQG